MFFFLENLDDLPPELDFDLTENGIQGDVDLIKRNHNGFNMPSTVNLLSS